MGGIREAGCHLLLSRFARHKKSWSRLPHPAATSPRVNKFGVTSLIGPRGRQGSALEPVVSLRSPPEAVEQASPPCGPPPLGSTSSVLPRLLILAAAKAPPWNLLSRFARQLAVSLRSTAARFAGLLR